MRRTVLLAIAGALALGPAGAALAREGVLEINQTCAAGSGCFPGDSAGFPVQITGAAGRNYRLTSDLTVSTANSTAIELSGSTPGFVIDLGGFALRGPGTCSGAPVVCTMVGTGSGVTRAAASTASAITVRYGTISGFGAVGVNFQSTDECVVENLVVRENASTGVLAATGTRVSNVAAILNGFVGIEIGAASLVESCTARENGGDGIGGGEGAVVVENGVTSNRTEGIDAGNSGMTFARNQARLNGNEGLQGVLGSVFIENDVSANGQVNASPGILAGSGSRIHANAVRENVGSGLDFTGDSAYSDNTFTANTVDQVVPATGQRGGNHCAGAGTGVATCP
jgi:hypothetical protein